jgi:hypothetical protein
LKTQIEIDFAACKNEEQTLDFIKKYFATIALNKDDDSILFNAVKSFVKKHEHFLNENYQFLDMCKTYIETNYNIKLIPKNELDCYKYNHFIAFGISSESVLVGNLYLTTSKNYKNILYYINDCTSTLIQSLKQILINLVDNLETYEITLVPSLTDITLVLKSDKTNYNIELPYDIMSIPPKFIGDIMRSNMYKV